LKVILSEASVHSGVVNMGKAKKRRSGAGKRTDPVGKNQESFLNWRFLRERGRGRGSALLDFLNII
jgi:hypothetical protein